MNQGLNSIRIDRFSSGRHIALLHKGTTRGIRGLKPSLPLARSKLRKKIKSF